VLDVYKQTNINQNSLNLNVDFKNGQRVFHQKFGMGLILSSEGDKLNISFDKAGEKRVIASFVKIVD
jgi:DNA helicase-2/ATP-dependent DNA helicase PcrA